MIERALGRMRQRAAAGVAEDGFGSRGEYRRHPATMAGEGPATRGIDPALNLVKPSRRNSSLDRSLLESQLDQLTPSHDPVLAVSDPPNRLLPLAKPHQGPIIGFVCGFGGHPAEVAGSHRKFGARFVPVVERKARESRTPSIPTCQMEGLMGFCSIRVGSRP